LDLVVGAKVDLHVCPVSTFAPNKQDPGRILVRYPPPGDYEFSVASKGTYRDSEGNEHAFAISASAAFRLVP
jgi:hypothetical protein